MRALESNDRKIVSSKTTYWPNVIPCDSIFLSASSWIWDFCLRNVPIQSGKENAIWYVGTHVLHSWLTSHSSVFSATALPSQIDAFGRTADERDFEGVGISRLPPRKYLMRDGALNSIRKEIWGLLSNTSSADASSDPPLKIVRIMGPSAIHLPRYATTLVVRQ